MEEFPKKFAPVVKAGFNRICRDFSKMIEPLGFSMGGDRRWGRSNGSLVDIIQLHRGGISYGMPVNYSVSIRIHFAIRKVGASEPTILNGPLSDQLRDGRGYAYHLRFNASSWSTYERCLEDLLRVTHDHGLPWFSLQRVSSTSSSGESLRPGQPEQLTCQNLPGPGLK